MTGAPIADVRERWGRETAHGALARGMFDRIAPTYDVLNRILSMGLDGRWRARAAASLRGAPPGPILDLCAGTLDLSASLEREWPGRRIVAVDFSRAMLQKGRLKAPRVELVVADAMALPFADGSHAAVVCGFGARNFADLRQGLREARRVLRAGGVFVTLELFRPVRPIARALHAGYARALFPLIGGAVSGDRAAYDYLARSMGGFLARDEYESYLSGAGFVRIKGQDLTFGIASIIRAEVAA